MNVSGMNLNNPPVSPGISQAKVESSTKTQAEAGSELSQGAVTSQGDTRVSISKEGRDALSSDSGGKLHAQAQAQSAESSEKPKKKIDELIEAVKEKLEKLKEELKQLGNDKSEAGEKKRKALQSEISVLTAQLMDLTNQKMEQEKKEQAGAA
ncbi:conserved hypothetical protein [Shewanella sediminis HAW-EB3]|uniref:Uncharacterized protein n=1 Tax=Shewanella sediminis (strain HAW-EB3) TaxID=425104 RepID=A8FYG3_SHESH|nr:hypothetical protein [Shewanella sediminis]ABV37886.1 conserved hypothetical protein [Shewanella sediminis HAW-EB3]